jgi:REP element-mobilizing transposase RayT
MSDGVSDFPLAYHITFGTYGARLHGGGRPTVHHQQNRPGDAFIRVDPTLQATEKARLNGPVVRLDANMRASVERWMPAICQRGGWRLWIAAAQHDHLHVLLSASRRGKAVRRWLKTWLGAALTDAFGEPAGGRWWAKGGSVKWVWDQPYLQRVHAYIRQQRTLGDRWRQDV